MNQVKVSVIVPVYNVEQHLSECLDSLVNQTLEGLEILVVNDGSPDNSQAIIDDYAARYPQLIRSFVKKNGGLSDARNYGVKRAAGEYIGFVDSDDYVRTDMLALLYERATADDADVAVCNYVRFNENSVTEVHNIKNEAFFGHSVEEQPQLLMECKSYAWNKLYRRSWYLENGFSFPKGQWFEDSAVVYNMMYLANRVSAVPESLYFYRVGRGDSITNTINHKMFDVFKSCESIKNFYQAHTENKAVLDVADRLCQIHIFVRIKDLITAGPLSIKWGFYRETLRFFRAFMPDWTENPYYKAVRKRTFYLKIRHIPFLMYLYLLLPTKLRKRLSQPKKKNKKKTKKKKKAAKYINQTRLRELQLIELDILKEIDRICREHDITYYLGEGSLLGAIRHQGFIPWDDDLDIVMPRADYNRFLGLVREHLSQDYVCLNEQTEPGYYLPFTKIISLDNHDFINKLDKFEEKYNGPFVDIFPLDYVRSNEPKDIQRQYRRVRRIRDEILLKAGYSRPTTRKKKFYYMLSKFASNERLYAQLRRAMITCEQAPYVCNLASSYHPSRQVVPAEVYGQPHYVPFEDGLFPVPQDAHTLLTTTYGDYMKLPGIRKRKSRHSFYDPISMASKSETKPLEDEAENALVLEEVRKLQLIELEILKEVDRVCKENGITYYLGEGTLLGAIRHQGFIPWDDDVDILMPREDLEKFMAICDEKLQSNYCFQYYHNIPRYWVQSPKVRLLDRTEFTQPALLKYTEHVGPYIDIFPLDYAPDTIKKLKLRSRYIKLHRRILFLKTGFSKPKNWKHKVLKAYSRFVSVPTIHKRMIKMATRKTGGSKQYLCNYGSYYSIKKEVFPIEAFGTPQYVQFEGCEFPVPSDYDGVLKTVYKDYMKLPPQNKQVAKHSFN